MNYKQTLILKVHGSYVYIIYTIISPYHPVALLPIFYQVLPFPGIHNNKELICDIF